MEEEGAELWIDYLDYVTFALIIVAKAWFSLATQAQAQ